MNRKPGKTSPSRLLLAGTASLALVACQAPGAVPPHDTTPPTTSGALVTTQDGAGVQSPVTADATLRGQAAFPDSPRIQALPADVVNASVLSLVEVGTNLTVVVGKSDAAGNFTLNLNGYTPDPARIYMLEAIKGLGNQGAGYQAARMRTFLKWTGTAWTSITQGNLVISPLTTALALISNMDTGIAPASLIGAVNGTNLVTVPAGYVKAEIDALATSLRSYLSADLDPVGSVSNYTPAITGITPPNGAVGSAVAIQGSGFSPLPGDNVVTFGGGAEGAVFMATSKQLIVSVPTGATTGNVTVKTRGKTSNASNFVVSAGGGGSGGPGGFYVSEVSPNNGVPGDYINLMGAGFSPTAASNTITFQKSGGGTVTVTPAFADANSLSVQVPATAISGPVSVTVGGNVSNRFYFNVNVPTLLSFTPNTGGPGTAITVNGSNFGAQGLQSGIKFNGSVNQAAITAWGSNQATVTSPGPSLTAKISGPITLSTAAGGLSQPFGNFTATSALTEGFTGAAGAGTTASWTGGTLQPATAVTKFSQTDFSGNTNSAGGVGSAAGFTIGGSAVAVNNYMAPTSTYGMQLGVDGTHFYMNNGGGTTIRRYNLATGNFVDEQSPGAERIIWDKVNNRFVGISGSASAFTFSSWGNFTRTTQSSSDIGDNTAVSFFATNGVYYFHMEHTGHTLRRTTMAWANAGSHSGTSPYACQPPVTAAGFVGSDDVLITPSSVTMSMLDRVRAGTWSTSAIALPFTLDGTGVNANNYPAIGSDGTYMYAVGRNASYNGNAISIYRFAYNGTTLSLTPASTTPETSTTAAITKAADEIWDTASFVRNVPAGTTCTIDVLNGSTNAVVKANITTGTNLNDITLSSIKLRATLQTTGTGQAPSVTSWNVTTRKAYALSPAYDSGSNFASYQAPTLTGTGVAGTDYTITYSDSADGTAWGADVSNLATLNRRYVRFKVNFLKSSAKLTQVQLPYTY